MSDDFDMQQQVSGDDHIPVRPSIDGQRCMTEHLEAPPVPSLPAQFRSRRKKSGDVLRQSISRSIVPSQAKLSSSSSSHGSKAKFTRKSVFGTFLNHNPQAPLPLSHHDTFASMPNYDDFYAEAEKAYVPEPPTPAGHITPDVILYHGEILIPGSGKLRRRTQHIVLTNQHIVIFKNQDKAAEVFPSILGHGDEEASSPAAVSPPSQFSDHSISFDVAGQIHLDHLVGAHKLDEERTDGTILEISYLQGDLEKPANMHFQYTYPEECSVWLSKIRYALKARSPSFLPFPLDHDTIPNLVQNVESKLDYDPALFDIFRVVQHVPFSTQTGPTEDYRKSPSKMYYLVVGAHKIHLIPVENQQLSSHSNHSIYETDLSFGILALTSPPVVVEDSILCLTFRIPLFFPVTLCLSSVHSSNIADIILLRTEYLRPFYVHPPFPYGLDYNTENGHVDRVRVGIDGECAFVRALVAYCAAFQIDTSNIRYSVYHTNHDCAYSPVFQLRPPAKSDTYHALEFLAVMRSLRYNTAFGTISFNGVNLGPLATAHDQFGIDCDDSTTTRTGVPVMIPGEENLSLLAHEVRALALKSPRLRKLDFTNTINQFDESGSEVGYGCKPTCGIAEALFPLIRRQLTSVDWVAINGIKLGEPDMDYLVDAVSKGESRLTGLEMGDCGISKYDFDLLMSTIKAQNSTLQVLDVSCAQGSTLTSPEFTRNLDLFPNLRKLNLSKLIVPSGGWGSECLITYEAIASWRLEELDLSHTPINHETAELLARYLQLPASAGLRSLSLRGCDLTGTEIAAIMSGMIDADTGKPRNLHLDISENRLATGIQEILQTLRSNLTPTYLTMSSTAFLNETNYGSVLEAIGMNSSLRYLDMSFPTMGNQTAGLETALSLSYMFHENNTLEELDLSFASAPNEIGLPWTTDPLPGLKLNTALRVLRLDSHPLGTYGLTGLASMLRENTTLKEIYCRNSHLDLGLLRNIVNSLRQNHSLVLLALSGEERKRVEDDDPRLDLATDSSSLLFASDSSISRSKEEDQRRFQAHAKRHSLLNALHFALASKPARPSLASATESPPDVASPTKSSSGSTENECPLDSSKSRVSTETSRHSQHEPEYPTTSWDTEVKRMHQYLRRNQRIACGISLDDAEKEASEEEEEPGPPPLYHSNTGGDITSSFPQASRTPSIPSIATDKATKKKGGKIPAIASFSALKRNFKKKHSFKI